MEEPCWLDVARVEGPLRKNARAVTGALFLAYVVKTGQKFVLKKKASDDSRANRTLCVNDGTCAIIVAA